MGSDSSEKTEQPSSSEDPPSSLLPFDAEAIPIFLRLFPFLCGSPVA